MECEQVGGQQKTITGIIANRIKYMTEKYHVYL